MYIIWCLIWTWYLLYLIMGYHIGFTWDVLYMGCTMGLNLCDVGFDLGLNLGCTLGLDMGFNKLAYAGYSMG